MINSEVDIILSRYFCGEATKKEHRILDNWLIESVENQNYFQQMTLLYQYVGQTKHLPTIDTEKALSQFKNYISKKQKNSFFFFKKPYLLKTAAAAAVAMLLISGFALFYFLRQSSNTVQLMASDTQTEFNLSENVKVTLFPSSKISYNTKKTNAIQLNGKAVFHIRSKDGISDKNSKETVIQAGETYIKDIGTVFTVDATNPDKSITVEVSEGTVNFYTKLNSGILIKSNECATYNVQTKQFEIAQVQSVASVHQELIFQNTPLQEAMDMIKIRYKVDILIKSEALKNIPINASFEKDESIENVLGIITETISAHLSKKGDTYIISSQ